MARSREGSRNKDHDGDASNGVVALGRAAKCPAIGGFGHFGDGTVSQGSWGHNGEARARSGVWTRVLRTAGGARRCGAIALWPGESARPLNERHAPWRVGQRRGSGATRHRRRMKRSTSATASTSAAAVDERRGSSPLRECHDRSAASVPSRVTLRQLAPPARCVACARCCTPCGRGCDGAHEILSPLRSQGPRCGRDRRRARRRSPPHRMVAGRPRLHPRRRSGSARPAPGRPRAPRHPWPSRRAS